MGIWRRRQVEKKDSVVVSEGEGVMATTSTRVNNHDCIQSAKKNTGKDAFGQLTIPSM